VAPEKSESEEAVISDVQPAEAEPQAGPDLADNDEEKE